MNHAAFAGTIPLGTITRDAVQVQSFVAAGDTHFFHLNQYLGLSLEPLQYIIWQQHYYRTEKKNPTMGELRLLGHLVCRLPQAQRMAPIDLYTDSDLIMETWADIMEGYRAIYGETDRPCSAMQVLSLPRAYLSGCGKASTRPPKMQVLSSSGVAQALTDGYEPLGVLKLHDGLQRHLWVRAREVKTVPTQCGDALLILPPADLSALSVLFRELLPLYPVKSAATVQHTSLLKAALELCGSYGLAVDLDTLVPAVQPQESRIARYLSLWESTPPPEKAYAVLCIPSASQAPLFTALSEHGFAPRLLGKVTKAPRVTFMDRGIVSVNLSTQIIHRPEAVIPYYRVTLPSPAPLGQVINHPLSSTPPTRPAETDCTVAHASVTVTGGDADAFTPAIQCVLSLCCDMAAAGILYDKLTLSPTLYVNDRPESPLLLSSVCGLYRACAELGIPMVNPEILFKNKRNPDETASLTLSLTASSEQTPNTSPDALQAAAQPLSLLSVNDPPTWDEIRQMLFNVVKAPTSVSVHSLHGHSVLSYLTYIASPEVNLTAQLFEEHKTELSVPRLFGFLAEGQGLEGSLHIGMTIERADGVPIPPPREASPCSPTVIPSTPVTLKELKDKETKRRKELAAMERIKAFEPLCKKPRTVLLDTDIGPDCDDVGALVTLIYYAKQYGFPIGGICNCTSNKAGNGVIDAVCRRCGIETPPLGQWSGEGFMDGQEHCKYNVAVAEAHSEAYRNGTLPVEDEVTFYRKRLAEAKDGDVMIISIGMFNDLAALLESPADDISPLSGMELVKAKVYALVSMAAILPQGRECNVVSDYVSAEKVFKSWPTAIYLSDFHIGVNVKTGYGHITDPETIMADPLPMSYHLYTKAWNWEGAVVGQNASYDLTAVQFAALGIGELYGLDTPGDLEFYAEIPDLPDATRFVENPMGNKIFMTKKVSDETLADSLQKIITSF